MAALDRIMCAAITALEFVVGQVGCEADVSWHAPVLQLHTATPYNATQLSGGGVGCVDRRRTVYKQATRSTSLALISLAGARLQARRKCETFCPMQSFHRASQPVTPHESTKRRCGHTGSDDILFPVHGHVAWLYS